VGITGSARCAAENAGIIARADIALIFAAGTTACAYRSFIVFMKTIAIGDAFHEEGNLNTACFLLPPFQGEIKPPAMRVFVDLICMYGVMVETAARKPIGIFDSGVGGLTVVKEVCKNLPHENIIYLGDTARVPYGTRSAQTVQKYAVSNTDFLLTQNIKLLVIACNTASAVAYEKLKGMYRLPIIDVVGPGARAAVAASPTKRIGIIGTDGTILSGAYQKEITRLEPESRIVTQACPLFVPLAEAGWCEKGDEVVLLTARRYLAPLMNSGIDTLVLGCTHYPLLKNAIREVMGPGIRLIDSAEETAKAILKKLDAAGLRNLSETGPDHRFMVSDIPHQFREVGERFLGFRLDSLSQVDLEAMASS